MKKTLLFMLVLTLLTALEGCGQSAPPSAEPPAPSPEMPSASVEVTGSEDAGAGSLGLIWEVSDEDTTVYLLGSIHLEDAMLYPFSKQFMDIIKTSDAAIFEVDLEDEDGIGYMTDAVLYDEDDKLSNHISEALMAELTEIYAAHGVYSSMLEILKPWFWASELESLAFYGVMPTTEPMVIDRYVYDTAKEAGVPIRQIESYQYQTDLFNTLDEETQEAFLQSSVDAFREGDAIRTLYLEMLTAWCARDLDAFTAAYDKDAQDDDAISAALFLERDANMTAYVLDILRDEAGQYLVTVGVGHMVGESGIVARLKQEGYNVNLLSAA